MAPCRTIEPSSRQELQIGVTRFQFRLVNHVVIAHTSCVERRQDVHTLADFISENAGQGDAVPAVPPSVDARTPARTQLSASRV